MTNPWLKKNPFMSMWLSSANSMMGAMRGPATAQAHRAMTTAATEAWKMWFDALQRAPVGEGAKRKR